MSETEFASDIKLAGEASRAEKTADGLRGLLVVMGLALSVASVFIIRQHGEIAMLRDYNEALSQIVTNLQAKGAK